MKLLLVLLLDGLILTLTGGGLGIYIHMYSYIIDEFVDPQGFYFLLFMVYRMIISQLGYN